MKSRCRMTTGSLLTLLLLVVLTQFWWAGPAAAQLGGPTDPWQFDITGFLQEATLNTASDPLSGGTLTVNGHVVTVPANTIVVFPANQLTWQEVFAQAPAPWGIPGTATPGGGVAFNGAANGPTTGMAAADCAVAPSATGCTAPPLVKYEVHVVGNVLPTGTGQGTYIAGLVSISQQGLNSGAGYINYIDYAKGEMRVGGTPGSSADGTRVQINDPIPTGGATGKFSKGLSPDIRFTLDPDNPTVRSATGFPMCLPRTDPNVADDPLCPQANRPLCAGAAGATFCGSFTTIDPATAGFPSAFVQAPFEIGDYVTFAGTLVTDNATQPTVGPYPGTALTYISAHTITNNIAIYTFPGTNPAYVATDVTLLGTGGTTVIGIGEATIRTRFEGFTTDPTRMVHLYGIDLACDGSVSGNRDWGTIGIDVGPPTGAVKGRWRFRPPCAPFGTDPNSIKFDKQCIMNQAGSFLPATREVRAVLEALPGTAQIPAWTAGAPTCAPGVQSTLLAPCNTIAANGLITGQYHAPITEYIFPEQVAGNPVPPANFETMPFLANGGYMSTAGTLAGQLSPWPGIPTPTATCATLAPTVIASAGPTTVSAGQVVSLGAVATGTPAPTITWAQTAGTLGTFSGATGAQVSWTAPVVAAQETATFTATAANGVLPNATSSVSVTVTPPPPPTVTATATPNQIASNATTALNATATGVAPFTFVWSQIAGPPGVLSATTGPSVSWTAPPVASATTVTIQVTVTDARSLTGTTTVVVGIDPIGAPVITTPIAAQTVTVGGAVSVPVTVTSTNTKATLGLIVTPNAFTSFKVNTVSNVCGTAGCTANFTINFTAPSVAQVITLSVTATDTSVSPAANSASATATVTVNAVPTPVVQHIAPQTVTSGTAVTMTVTATSPSQTANLTLQVPPPTQTNNPALTLVGFSVNGPSKNCVATGCTFSWTVKFTVTLPTAPLQTTPDVLSFTITATDVSVNPNLVSASEFTTVTVNPAPDTILITSAEDRTGKQRVIINATSSVISPNLVLKLQPYLCEGGVTACPGNGTAGPGSYDPCAGVGCTLTNNGGGLYVGTFVGAPKPACKLGGTYATPCTQKPIDVKSNIGGDSGFSALTRIRN